MGDELDTGTEPNYADWIGRTREDSDFIDLNRAYAMHAMFGAFGPAPDMGSSLAPLGHWLYFWEFAPPAGLGPDGHPRKGEFLPPIRLPRRMWAGSRVRFLAPLPIGKTAWRRSTIANVQIKSGKSGQLGVVTVRYEIGSGSTVAIEDEQDIIYREAAPIRGAAVPSTHATPKNTLMDRQMKADPVMLFRYSALTFNGHRIHYDRTYATQEEQYPGLVVHGPLLATLMVRAACEARTGANLASFRFRAESPVFDVDEFRVGVNASASLPNEDETWIMDHRGTIAFKGTATFK
jgi:3-methylfumaryl-CoA hydratase